MKTQAYPQIHNITPKRPFNVAKWREIALKIKMAARQYEDYTTSELVDYFTKDWDFQEREHFKNWFDYNTDYQGYRYKRGQSMNTEKVAYDFQSSRKEEDLRELKKKLRSRITSAEKLLTKMLDEGLLVGSEEKAIYISRILQKLKEEINLLRQPQLIQGRCTRVIRIARKAGLDEVANTLYITADTLDKTIIRVGEAGLSQVLEAIKTELDAFNYGLHLNRLMDIKKQLESLGRHSEAGSILEIIKKELNGIDGIHKKLVDVYTSLSQIPKSRPSPKPSEPDVSSAREFEEGLAKELGQTLGEPPRQKL